MSGRIRRWYEDELGWPTVPGEPVRLVVGARFDVLDVPADAGRAALSRLGPNSPVAVHGDRMRLLVAAGSAEELPGLLEWLEWGTLALDLRAIGAGGLMEAPSPPGPGGRRLCEAGAPRLSEPGARGIPETDPRLVPEEDGRLVRTDPRQPPQEGGRPLSGAGAQTVPLEGGRLLSGAGARTVPLEGGRLVSGAGARPLRQEGGRPLSGADGQMVPVGGGPLPHVADARTLRGTDARRHGRGGARVPSEADARGLTRVEVPELPEGDARLPEEEARLAETGARLLPGTESRPPAGTAARIPGADARPLPEGDVPSPPVYGPSVGRPFPLGRLGSQGAAVWLRPPEPGCEVEASLPTLSALGGCADAPDLVRLVDTVATQCHRIRLWRACAEPPALRAQGR